MQAKSGTAYENIIREASANPDRLYYVIVPETVHDADTENSGGNASGWGNPQY